MLLVGSHTALAFAPQVANDGHSCLLRLRNQRHRYRAGQPCDEFPAPHSITSAAHRREATPITLSESRTAKVRPVRVVGEGARSVMRQGGEERDFTLGCSHRGRSLPWQKRFA